jgi:hypothetical protein
MPDDHVPPAEMSNLELKHALERVPERSEVWHALIREAGSRPTFPVGWLPGAARALESGDFGSLSDLELKSAIDRNGDERDALLHVACSRPSFPRSWLPRGVSWSERTDHGSSGIRADGT